MSEPRSDLDRVRQAARDHVVKLERAEVTPDGTMPKEAMEALSELARLATELANVRGIVEVGQEQGQGSGQEPPCQKYNTWWNAFKMLLGIRDDRCECMNRTYNEEDWCV